MIYRKEQNIVKTYDNKTLLMGVYIVPNVGTEKLLMSPCFSLRAMAKKTAEGFEEVSSNNALLKTCQRTISICDADVHVDLNGVLQSKAAKYVPDPNQSTNAIAKHFTNKPEGNIA